MAVECSGNDNARRFERVRGPFPSRAASLLGGIGGNETWSIVFRERDTLADTFDRVFDSRAATSAESRPTFRFNSPEREREGEGFAMMKLDEITLVLANKRDVNTTVTGIFILYQRMQHINSDCN